MTVTSIKTTQGFIILPATTDEPARIMVPFTGAGLDLVTILLERMTHIRGVSTLVQQLDDAAEELEGA